MTSTHPATPLLTIADAQRDMRTAFFDGAPGVLTSGMVWLVAGLVALFVSAEKSVWALFIGGMLIHPIGLLVCKVLGRSGKQSANNPLGLFAGESTAWLIVSLPLAYAVSLYRIELFFPAMLLVIGGRYLGFHTLFGLRWYWACGVALILLAYLLASTGASPGTSALAGGAIELVFAALLFASHRRRNRARAEVTD